MTKTRRIFPLGIFLCLFAFQTYAAEVVTVYVALDRDFSAPILKQFEEQTGIKVQPVYDVEATKTIGLVNRIISEKERPLCDVFWNNEILQTFRLKSQDLLVTYDSPAAKSIPDAYRDPEHYWTGFAARARVIIYNTNLIDAADVPLSLLQWGSQPSHKGRFAVADAHFGTTSTHLATLVSALGAERTQEMIAKWKAADVAVLAGNATVRNEVAAGRYAFGLTDTDDAYASVDEGKPVGILYPEQGLLIPNTVALIKNAPHPEQARKLIDFILSAETEEALAFAPSGQIPLRAEVKRPERVPAVDAVNSLQVKWPDVLQAIPQSVRLADDLVK